MLLRHYSSSLTIIHHLGIHMHINVVVTTLVHCALIKEMDTVVAVHPQALGLWAMASALPAVSKRCISERQGRKGGGIVAWRAHHATGQVPGGQGTDSRQGVVLEPWVGHTLWPQPHHLPARHRHPHPLPPPLLPLLSLCIPWRWVAVHHHHAATSTGLSMQKNWLLGVWSHLGHDPVLGFQHVVALAGWWIEQGNTEGEATVRMAFGWNISRLLWVLNNTLSCGNMEDIYYIDTLVKNKTIHT